MSRQYWSGKVISKLEENEVFVYGSNPQGINGAGAAKAAMSLSPGSCHGVGRGLNGTSAYAVVTKSLNSGFLEKSTGILYDKEGYKSVSESQIRENIKELYETAKTMPEKAFLISYQLETWPNGSPKKSLNGYTSKEILDMFIKDQDIPDNIVFHDSYQKDLEKVLGSSVNVKSASPTTNTPTEIAFTKVSLPFGWMGNMAPYPVVYEGQEYKTTEALFQALRFEDFPDIQQKIMAEKSPMSAKLVAKEHKQLLIDNGYEVMGTKDVENMRLCVKLKLEQHPDLAQQLVDTGNAVIIENCTSRPEGSGVFWGSAKQDNGSWVGKNVLGEVLMDFRDKLQHNKELQVSIEQPAKVAAVEENKPKEYTFFFHLTSPFSNFHPSKFEYKDLTFISNEQFMMYSKAKTFKDEVTAQKIIDMNNQPLIKDFIEGKYSREDIVKDKVLADQWNKLMMRTKSLGKDVTPYDDTVWSNRRAKVVLFGARLKFSQNEDLKQILLATGDTYMVEASRYDKIWGIGLSADDARKIPEHKWPGLNLLGKDLDIVKAEFKAELTAQVETTVKKKPR